MIDEQSDARPSGVPPARVPLPLGLWAISALLVVGAILFLLGIAAAGPSILAGGLIGLQDTTEGRVVLAVLAAAMFVAAAGLVLRIRSAWGLTMLIVGIGLAVNLFAYFRSDPNYLRLALFVVIAFYLNQSAVREVFLGTGVRRFRG